MSHPDDPGLAAIRAGIGTGEGRDGTSLVASPVLGSVRAYGDLDALDAAMAADPRVYRRDGNETVDLLERTLARLETPPGRDVPLARVTASGLAALVLAAGVAAMSGRRGILVVRPCYGGTEVLVNGPLAAMGMSPSVVDVPPGRGADAGELVAAALTPSTALVVVETVTNPLLGVVDVGAVASAAHEAGALCLVDNTFATPFLFQPLWVGADLVLHSLTKHLSGHSDVLGGVLVAAPGSEPADWLDAHSRALGAVLSPFDAWLTLRGLRTAPLRVERGTATAALLAQSLVGHAALVAVHHPSVGPDAALAARLLPRGGAAMLTLDVRGGLAGAAAVVVALDGIRLAPSLGDVSTTLTHPATTSHRHLSAQAKAALGISDGLLRVSVGIEDPTTLLGELTSALDAAV